jgi:hypothetical protein
MIGEDIAEDSPNASSADLFFRSTFERDIGYSVFSIFSLEEKYYAGEFECAQALTNQTMGPAKTQFNVNPNLKYPQTISGVGRPGPSPPILPSRSSPSCS